MMQEPLDNLSREELNELTEIKLYKHHIGIRTKLTPELAVLLEKMGVQLKPSKLGFLFGHSELNEIRIEWTIA